MTLQASIANNEALEQCKFDVGLLAELECLKHVARRPLRVATPSFQSYATSELAGCCASVFPVFSVTGSACALQCDHCRAGILGPMIPATSPAELDVKVRELARRRKLGGFLLSGGSNRRNEIAYERFYPVIERLKRDLAGIRIAVHSALVDRPRALQMADAGIDTVMMDVIGAEETIRQVYHLDRPVADFAASLAALCETGMEVVPHIVIGLHYGRILGEATAIEICASQPIDGLVLVVVMPQHARPGTFATPDATDVGRLFVTARGAMGGKLVGLGCARPFGLYRRTIDAYAVLAGMDSIAFPSEGAIRLAREIGRPVEQNNACCGMRRGVDSIEVTV